MRPWARNTLEFAVAFAVGASIAIVMSNGEFLTSSTPIAWALGYLSPGVVLGWPFVAAVTGGFQSGGSIVPHLAIINGLLFGFVGYFGRNAARGRKDALIVVVVVVGIWTFMWARLLVENWPRPEPPPAPVDLASPLAGRWEGVVHGNTREVPVILVLHPRTDGTLDGFYYINGFLSGPLFEGTYSGDSIRFDLSWAYSGHRDGARMTLEDRVSGRPDRTELQFVSADTTRLALPPLVP